MLFYNIFLAPETLLFYAFIVAYLVFFVTPMNNDIYKQLIERFKQRKKDAEKRKIK